MSSLQSSGDGPWVLKCVSQGLCSLSSISSQGALFLSWPMLQGNHHHPQNVTLVRKAGNSSREEVNLRSRNLSTWHFCCYESWSKGEEEFLCFTISWEATAERKSRQELTTVTHILPTVKTTEKNASLPLFLTQLAFLSLSYCTGIWGQGMVKHTVEWTLPHQLTIKTIPDRSS